MNPSPDGSHDNINENEVHPKTVKWMADIIDPLFGALSEPERQEFLMDMAELLEDDMREHDPENSLLEMLDEKRRDEKGFE